MEQAGGDVVAHGDAVAPLNLRGVCANIFTDPEIATVGYSQADVDEGRIEARVVTLPLSTNPRAKMRNIKDGFVKLFARTGSGTVIGGVVVAPKASDLILPIALAVIMFGLGLTLTVGDFLRIGRDPKPVVLSLGAQLLLLPVICFGLVLAFAKDKSSVMSEILDYLQVPICTLNFM